MLRRNMTGTIYCALFAVAYALLAHHAFGDTPKSVPVYDGPESTAFSIYGTSPESPDGTHISYVRYERLSGSDWSDAAPAALWVCNRDLTGHRKLADIRVHNHNGANAIWVDNETIAYTSPPEGISVINANTGERRFDSIPGKLGHNAFGRKVLFGVHPGGDYETVESEGIGREPGIYELDCTTGDVRQVLTAARVVQAVKDAGRTARGNPAAIIHLQYSPDGRRISFRWGRGQMATANIDGTNLLLFPGAKPMHFLWYDNDTLMGSDYNVSDGKEDNHRYRRWKLDGTFLETIAGRVTHGDASPDRQWYAGEDAAYYETPIRLVLYRRGQTTPTATLFDHSFANITWKLRAHVNPAFAPNGQRLYFIRATSDNRFEASYVRLSEIAGE